MGTSKHCFPEEYQAVSDIPVKLSFDPRLISYDPHKRLNNHSSKIFKYDDILERKIIERYEKNQSPQVAKPAKVGTFNKPLQSVNTLNNVPKMEKFNPPEKIPPIIPPANADSLTIDPQLKALELAQVYLPDDTEERRNLFVKIYLQSRESSDLDILRAYIVYDGDVEKAVRYLKSFSALKELGFPEDQISSALLLYKNNQEEALEHLMKNC